MTLPNNHHKKIFRFFQHMELITSGLPDIETAVTMSGGGVVYSDELSSLTRRSVKAVTLWLSANGFQKEAGCQSRRWVNHSYVGTGGKRNPEIQQ